jgi:hypothetical protein
VRDAAAKADSAAGDWVCGRGWTKGGDRGRWASTTNSGGTTADRVSEETVCRRAMPVPLVLRSGMGGGGRRIVELMEAGGAMGANERGDAPEGMDCGETGMPPVLGVRKETPPAECGPGLGGGRPTRTERRVRMSSVKENSRRYLTFSARPREGEQTSEVMSLYPGILSVGGAEQLEGIEFIPSWSSSGS